MDIRDELKKLNKATLKDLVVRHDLHYYINKTGKKAELVEGLARVYESITGSNLVGRAHKLPVVRKLTPAEKEKIKKVKAARRAKYEASGLEEDLLNASINAAMPYLSKGADSIIGAVKSGLNQTIGQMPGMNLLNLI